MNFLDGPLQDIPDIGGEQMQVVVPQPPQDSPNGTMRNRFSDIMRSMKGLMPHRGKSLRFRILLGIGILAMIYVFGLGISALFVRNALSAVADSKASAQQAAEALARMDFAESSVATKQAVQYLSEAQKSIKRAWLLKTVPWVRTQILGMEALIDASATSAESALKVANWVSEMPFAMSANEAQSLSPEERRMAFGKMIELPSLVTELNTKVAQSERIINALPKQGMIRTLAEAGERLKQQLALLKSLLAPYVPIAEIMPQVADSGEDKAYLWLLLNNDELRPTGGYISAYGITVFRNGRLEEFVTDNARNLDKGVISTGVQAPYPIARFDTEHNKGNALLFHDAAWSPDYPTAVKTIEQLFVEQNKLQGRTMPAFNGVFAITPSFVAKFLELTGPIELAGYNVTPKNISDVLEIDSHRGFRERNLSEEDRKQLIFDLGLEIIKRLGSKPLTEWPKMVSIFEAGLKERHMLVMHTNSQLQSKVSAQGYGGAIQQVGGDYLQLVDANLGSFKSDIGIERSITYMVSNTQDKIRAIVRVRYDNKNTLIWKTRPVYTTYSRIYVPLGSKLRKVRGIEGKSDASQEAGKAVFGGLVRVPIGRSKTVVWEYTLPANAIQPLYTLLVQKQAGTKSIPISVNIQLPGKELLRTSGYLNVDKRFQSK